MTPVICFFENDFFIWSDDYFLTECPHQENPATFLKNIEINFPSHLKIIQANYDCFEPQNKKALIEPDALVSVYILKSHELIKKTDLMSNVKEFDFKFVPAISQKEFQEKVLAIKKDIQSGRYYQVNLTSHFTAQLKTFLQPLEIFKFYLNKFNSEYCAFLPRLNSEILCYSPELFLEKRDSLLLTRPIKGTTQKNEKFNDLLKSEKEDAELSMIVDLLRNDLQSVCHEKVTVVEHRKELQLNYLTHTYSEITGQTNQSLPEILKAMLPAGSISGCPKRESVLAINQLETTRRHFYTGCIGWWKGPDFKLNLAIRSFLNFQNTLTYFSGCGIVYDSIPENEWHEFLRKAKHLELKNDI